MLYEGLIIKITGGLYTVKTSSGIYACRARGRFRKDGMTPLSGDRVSVETAQDGTGFITEILPRKNSLVRPAVANIDLLVIVASLAPPVTDLRMIDRLCALAEILNIEPLLCVNKKDLADASNLVKIYRSIGIRVIETSAADGSGTNELKEALKNRISAFAGHSGVGKSSLLCHIDSRFSPETGEISEKIGRGKHTTRYIEFFELENGGYAADTPGFSMFDAVMMNLREKDNIKFGFREFAPYFGKCKYDDCAHTVEQGCAIIDAVDKGVIEKSRHTNYVELYNEIKDIKSWMQ